MWNPDSFLENLYERFEGRRNGRENNSSNWKMKRGGIREQLHASLEIDKLSEMSADLNPVLLDKTEYDDHIRERVEFTTIDGLRVPAYVLIPKSRSGKLPAVVALHGHGYGSREIVGLAPDGSDNLEKPGIHGNYALELVKRGMLVVAPEIIGFGDRRLAADMGTGKVGNSSCSTLTSHLLLYGIPIAGLRVQEVLRSLDYLVTRKEADPERVGCIGFSGGGLIGAYAAALDERIKATVLCSFTNTFKGSIMAVHHCIDNYVPGVLRFAELPELIGLIAPRALFIESGERDPIFPVQGVKEAIAILQDIYRYSDAKNRIQFDLHEGLHEVSGINAYPWLVSAL